MSAERTVVGEPEFQSYYGRPVIKAPVWRADIPAYLFTGGLAAGSALLAAGADATGRAGLRRVGGLTAAGAAVASAGFLIHDLGRPERFHHMLRVAKPTSPMSMGTWVLSGFGAASGAAAAVELAGWLAAATPPEPRGLARFAPGNGRSPRGRAWRAAQMAGRVGGLLAAGLAPALATYPAVLLSDTAVPSWHEARPALPYVFAGSSLASAAGVGLLAAPLDETAPARRMAFAGAALELAGARHVETRMGLLSEPYRTGRAGWLLRAGKALTAAGAAGAALGGRSRLVSALSGAALLAGSAATRFGVYEAGVASAKDPKYTVLPQRQRLAETDECSSVGNPARYM